MEIGWTQVTWLDSLDLHTLSWNYPLLVRNMQVGYE
jgi:hypothetical protein